MGPGEDQASSTWYRSDWLTWWDLVRLKWSGMGWSGSWLFACSPARATCSRPTRLFWLACRYQSPTTASFLVHSLPGFAKALLGTVIAFSQRAPYPKYKNLTLGSHTTRFIKRSAAMFLSKLFLSAGATLLAFSVWKVFKLLYSLYKSPLGSIPGPRSSHFFYGNMLEIFDAVSDRPYRSSVISHSYAL